MTETPLTPEASVIVPSRGGAQRLPRLLRALAHQEGAPAFEICVVLDGDIDGFIDAVAYDYDDDGYADWSEAAVPSSYAYATVTYVFAEADGWAAEKALFKLSLLYLSLHFGALLLEGALGHLWGA